VEPALGENFTSHASVPVGVPGQLKITPSDASGTRDGIVGTEELLHNWRIDEHEHRFREEQFILNWQTWTTQQAITQGRTPLPPRTDGKRCAEEVAGGASSQSYGLRTAICMVPGVEEIRGRGHVTHPCWVVDCVTWVVALEWRGTNGGQEQDKGQYIIIIRPLSGYEPGVSKRQHFFHFFSLGSSNSATSLFTLFFLSIPRKWQAKRVS